MTWSCPTSRTIPSGPDEDDEQQRHERQDLPLFATPGSPQRGTATGQEAPQATLSETVVVIMPEVMSSPRKPNVHG